MSEFKSFVQPTDQTVTEYLNDLFPIDIVNQELRDRNAFLRGLCANIFVLRRLSFEQSVISELGAYMTYAIYAMYRHGICSHANLAGYSAFASEEKLSEQTHSCAFVALERLPNEFTDKLTELFPDIKSWLHLVGIIMFHEVARHQRETDGDLRNAILANLLEVTPAWKMKVVGIEHTNGALFDNISAIARLVQIETKSYTNQDVRDAIQAFNATDFCS